MEQEINWPSGYLPKESAIHVRNVIHISGNLEEIWNALVDAKAWPEWYPHAENVVITSAGSALDEGAQFKWKTMGVPARCEVVECIPQKRLAWTGKVLGMKVCHAWLMVPDETGFTVITEETQRGLLAFLGKSVLPKNMFKAHQLWLELLREKVQ